MKQSLLFLSMIVLLFSCKKDDSTTTTPGNPTNPYYFKFKLDGTDYNLASGLAQYISSDPSSVGGFQQAAPLSDPSIGLRFNFGSDTVTDAQVVALAGRTINFNSPEPSPKLTFDASTAANTLFSIDTSNTSYNVKITSVTYLKKDTTIFNRVAVYVIKGTCSAVFEGNATGQKSILSNGEFNFLISRVDR